VTPYCYEIIENLLEMRHDIVHDIDFKKTITKREIEYLSEIVMTFTNVVEFFLEERVLS